MATLSEVAANLEKLMASALTEAKTPAERQNVRQALSEMLDAKHLDNTSRRYIEDRVHPLFERNK